MLGFSFRYWQLGMTLVAAGPVLADDWLNMSLEQLLNVEVYSASRQLEQVRRAPAVITVINAQQIRQRGLKTLKEVLDRVPGFLTLPGQSTYQISNRGFTQNPNSNYLILWNNHPMNNQRLEGAEEYMLFPDLALVDRIEVIRGPGSTLWGADAAMGVINVISKDAAQLLHQDEQKMVSVSMLYDAKQQKNTEALVAAWQLSIEQNLLLNVTRSASQACWTDYYEMASQGLNLSQTFMNPYLSYDPSVDLQLSYQNGPWQFRWRDFHFNHTETFGSHHRLAAYPGQSTTSNKDTEMRNLVLSYHAAAEADWRLSGSAFYDRFLVNNKAYYLDTLPDLYWALTRFYYWDAGTDLMLQHQLGSHSFKAGLQYTFRDFTELRQQSSYRPDGSVLPDIIFHPLGYERSLALYAEDEWQGLAPWYLTFGLRYDQNDFRLPGEQLYPRFSAVYLSESAWSFKYNFNQGYVRPVLERADGSFQKPLLIGDRMQLGPQKPQTALSHDLQWSYQAAPFTLAVTLYQYDLKDFIARLGYEPGTTFNGYVLRYQNQNIGDIRGRGIELEWNYAASADVNWYGNLAVANARFDQLQSLLVDGSATFNIVTDMNYAAPDRRTTGVPRYIWQLGLDWQVQSWLSLNLHYRGFADIIGKISTAPQFARYGPEHLLDLTLNMTDVLWSGLDLQLFARNPLSGTLVLPTAAHGGVMTEDDRQLGLQFSWRF